MKRRFIVFCIFCLSCVILLAGCKNKKESNTNTSSDPAVNPNYATEDYLSGTHYVQMDIANYGSIIMELDADAAPATVTNFINLVQQSFYDGLTFHRIIDGFMIQGGDPKGNGTGGSEFAIPGEFSSNGFENPISHVRGTISMARSKKPDSASSQFFIVHQDAITLDGSYAAFGKILYGMEIVDAICANAVVTDNNGTVPAEYQPVINSTLILGKDAIDLLKQQEIANLPDPTATISFASISSTEDLPLVDTWNIDDNGPTYVLFSSENLVSIGIYKADLVTGIEYDDASPLGYYSDIKANEYISVNLNIPVSELPTLLLVAKEASGAIGQYLICYDEYYGGVYLVPVIN